MSAPFRILHVADCHLDAPSRSLEKAVRARLEEAARTALERAVACAIAGGVDALVLAGDLFDRDLLRIPTELWLPELLGEATAAGITVIAVTGNHDPGGGVGPLDRIRWPASGFHLVRDREPRAIEVFRADGTTAGVVVAAGHETNRESANLVASFPTLTDVDVPVVGLVHAQVHGYEGEHDRYAPCTPADLDRPGYDYWALGHVHGRGPVAASAAAWYAGCLQGRHIGEAGAKGVLEVAVTRGGPAGVVFHPVAPVRWEELVLDDLDEVADSRALLEHVARRFAAVATGPDVLVDQEWILRLTVGGRTPLFAELRGAEGLDDLAVAVRDRLGVLDVHVRDAGVAPPVDVAAHAGRPHVLGAALALVAEARLDPELLDRLAPDRLAGAPLDEAGRAAYLRALLDGLDLEIAAAMLTETSR
jgi:DNA repair exonuclease SbcCD nuclease subunit